jgi:hypothetical protein
MEQYTTLTVAPGETLTVTGKFTVRGELKGSVTVGGASDYVTFSEATLRVDRGTLPEWAVLDGTTGTVTLAPDNKLELANGGSITTKGGGTLVAGETTFSGVGQWVAGIPGGTFETITITSAPAGATIAFATNNGGPATEGTLTAYGTGLTITQKAGRAGNNLTIGDKTTITLSVGADPHGSISLGQGSYPGKLTLKSNTSTILTLSSQNGAPYSNNLDSIDNDAVISGITKEKVFQHNNKLTKLIGDAFITGNTSGTNFNSISGDTATVGS